MNLESVRAYCLSFPNATEMIQWGSDLLFKIGGKMFTVAATEPGKIVVCFKATPEHFFEYQEREGIIPAPYMARNQWLALEHWGALRDDELRELIAISYRLVLEKLPKRTQQELQGGARISARKVLAKKRPAKTAAKKTKKKIAKKVSNAGGRHRRSRKSN